MFAGRRERSPLLLDGSGDLYVVNYNAGTVGEYNATTGAAINAHLLSGLDSPSMIALAPAAIAAPEPASIALLGIGIAGLAGYGSRRRRRDTA